jgi:transcription antitermination factor NusA-like protein
MNKGKFTELGLQIIRSLHSWQEEFPSLRDVELKGIIESENIILITSKRGVGKLVGRNGQVVRKIAKEFGKTVRVVEEENLHQLMLGLLVPTPVLGINVVYTPEESFYKIRVRKEHSKSLKLTPEQFADLVFKHTGERAELVFE